MKIGVISDTHIPDRAPGLPPKLVKALKGVDMIIHAGDLVELSVLDDLRKICPDVRAVLGNMDSGGMQGKLQERLLIKAGDFTIGVMHGYGPPQGLVQRVRDAFKTTKVDCIVFGHSHQPLCVEDTPSLLNPGSPTDTVFAPYQSFGMIEIGDTMKLSIIKLE